MSGSLQHISVALCCALFAGYFGYHTLYGKHGLEAQRSIVERRAYVDQQLLSLEAVHQRLRKDIAVLDPTHPGYNGMVEEVARETLGFAYPGERILVVRHAR
jgi:cell division protein FtsB